MWLLRMDVENGCFFINIPVLLITTKHVLSVDEAGKVIMINKNITETLAWESLTDNVTEDVTENENNTSETQDIDEELISIVQQRPALYDHRIPLQERTKLKKKDLWQEVSNCIGEAYSPVDAEKRWQYLRDCYTKARSNFKKIQSTEKRSGAAGTPINKPSFRYYDAMSFLNDTLEYKETCTSLRLSNKRDTARVTNLPSPSCSSTNDGNDDYTDLENRPPSSVSELSATTSSSQKRRRSNNTDEIDRALLEALNTNVQPSPIDGFMLRLAEGMRRLPYRERSNLELEFLMKLRETEERLGLLDNI